jgi:foldase protein PrsA
MRIPRVILALGAVLALAAGVAGCGSSVPGNAVAVMAGNPITIRAFDHWMFVAAKGTASSDPSAPVIVPIDPPGFKGCLAQVRKQLPSLKKTPDKTIISECGQLFKQLSAQVMDFLIKSYWYQAEAHKLGITLTQAQLNKAFESAKKSNFHTAAQFKLYLKETGQTVPDILFRVRIQQLLKKLLSRHMPKITPAAISAYFKAHPTQFGTSETRDIRMVRAKTESRVLAAKSALKAGQSWKAVAKKYSVDTATKNDGGLLSGITAGEEEHALSVAAFAAPTGAIEGPIHGTFGWYVFEVTKIHPATHQTLKDATAEIKQLLNQQYGTKASTDVNAEVKKAWGKQTLCRALYSMDDCSGYKPPKTTSTTTPAPTTTTTSSTPSTTSTTPSTTQSSTTTPTGTSSTATGTSSTGSTTSTTKTSG